MTDTKSQLIRQGRKGPTLISSGDRFGRLVVIHEAERATIGRGGERRKFHCRCDCGNIRTVEQTNLRSGSSRSCGCIAKEKARARTTHGHTRDYAESPEYRAWGAIKTRTTNPNAIGFKNYGGRGILLSEEFANDFAAFLAHLGPKPAPHFTIDRIDNNKGYERGNLRWATRVTQARNKRTNKFTMEIIREIRALRGHMTQKEIGELYNVPENRSYLIHANKAWKDD